MKTMELSIRLKAIASMVEKCTNVVDVGTDHGYVPIYLVKNEVIESAIASDINKGPVEKAKKNVLNNNLSHMINCRLGSGLSTISRGEVQVAIIAGMGGNLIRDILEADLEVVKQLEYMILQPVQNAEILREYLYNIGYDILDEEICYEDDKFYEIIKAKYNTKSVILDSINYEISKVLLDKKNPVMKKFIEFKLQKYTKIYQNLNVSTISSKTRKQQLYKIITALKEFSR
jgi:tRNA (adenine22-N1)-methyltransferase